MLKEHFSSCIDLLFPRTCHACSKILRPPQGSFDEHLCLDCFAAMKKMPFDSFDRRLICCYQYRGTPRELIHQWKYDNRPYLSRTIVRLMLKSLEHYSHTLFQNTDCLIPVPLHPGRYREREFNQSELIAQDLGRLFNKPCVKPVTRVRNTPPQTMAKTSRINNVRGAFRIADPDSIRHKNILIVDDVVTTGATVNAMALLLKKAGAKKITCLAFAKG